MLLTTDEKRIVSLVEREYKKKVTIKLRSLPEGVLGRYHCVFKIKTNTIVKEMILLSDRLIMSTDTRLVILAHELGHLWSTHLSPQKEHQRSIAEKDDLANQFGADLLFEIGKDRLAIELNSNLHQPKVSFYYKVKESYGHQ